MADSYSGDDLKPETRVILLLCAKLDPSGPDDLEPLKPREYEQLIRWLQTTGIRPRDLLDPGALQALADGDLPISLPRLYALLDRDALLDTFVEGWANKGGWIVSRAEACYPRRLLEQPHFPAPPLLYGVGDASLLSMGGLAIVGSRHADDDALAFARLVARTSVRQDMGVVSGSARGVDSAAMDAALEAGGRVIGMLADSLAKTAGLARYRDALRDGRLVLASSYNPATGFHAGNAMGRNKYIYALADWGVVVSASLGTGGTWAGALEAIKHGRHVFVRTQGMVPEGNRKLLELGAHSFPEPWPRLAETLSAPVQAALQSRQPTAYDLVLQLLVSHLEQPHDLPALARLLDVPQKQAQAWVRKAIKEGRIDKVEGSEPPRYMLSRQQRMPFVAEAEGEYVASCDATQSNFTPQNDDVRTTAGRQTDMR